MGSPPAPHLANGWLSQFDKIIKSDSMLYERYMDDILCESRTDELDSRLVMLNNLHANLSFTIEKEIGGKISFLDMTIYNDNGSLSSGWYRKPTDTGLTLNFHSLAPNKYKRSVVISAVFRVFRACSDWKNVHIGLEEVKKMLHDNQYPDYFVDPIIHTTLCKLVDKNYVDSMEIDCAEDLDMTRDVNACVHVVPENEKFRFFVLYRGKPTDMLAKQFKRLNAPCKVIMTTRKLKTCLPSLKPVVPRMLLSNVVYKLTCPGCGASYVGQTVRHIQLRVREHLGNKGTMNLHFRQCSAIDNASHINENDILVILDKANNLLKLLTLEALYQQEIKPCLNTKDEYRSRTLTLKFY